MESNTRKLHGALSAFLVAGRSCSLAGLLFHLRLVDLTTLIRFLLMCTKFIQFSRCFAILFYFPEQFLLYQYTYNLY
jgi:hypothetical protein